MRATVLPAAVSTLVDDVVSGAPHVGRVLTVLPSVAYVEVAGTVLALETSAGLGLPIAVRVRALTAPWDVAPGDPVLVGEGEVVLGSLTLRVVRSWPAPRVRLGSSTVRCDLPPAATLVGRGPGLTPAGDDVLCGALLMLRALGDTVATAQLWSSVAPLLPTTSSISASLLVAASTGHALAVVRDLVHAVADDDPLTVARLVPQVERIGHSSGRDLLAGSPQSPYGRSGSVPELTEVRSGSYADSVSLMQVSAAVRASAGVTDCIVAMGTPLNVELLDGLGFVFDAVLGANDLAVAIRADDDAALARARDALEASFAELAARSSRSSDLGGSAPHRTVGAARGEADLALISVPGRSAFVEAMDALDHGLSVMVFSDNVGVDEEVALKDVAAERGLLVMGPDCGTAVVSGVALGFANVVRPGSVGMVAASGTGAQQVMCLLDAAGVGISHCLGVGGRDLSTAVGGRATKQALLALDGDPATETVLVVSKPPAPEVLADVRALADKLSTPVHWATLSAATPSLTDAVEALLGTAPDWPALLQPAAPVSGSLRGLFVGGTLADEAMLLVQEARGPVRSNIPLSPDLALGPDLRANGDVVIDFGDDLLTQGRPHPMIDPSLRLERIAAEAADPTCGVLLLDLVLGHGAHPDPAPELAAAIRAARSSRPLPVVVTVVGTAGDPQGLKACRTALHAAGASVFVSNSQATRHAISLLEAPVADTPLSRLLATEPRVVTAGAEMFADALRAQAVAVTSVDWRPPPDGSAAALARVMGDVRRERANATAIDRLLTSTAHLVDVLPASEVLGLELGSFLHAGPPIEWERASGPLRGALIGAVLFERLADTPDAAERLLASGGVSLDPCHHRGAVGPMAGVVSPSMWMFVLEDPVHGGRAYCSLNEGLGKVLRYGAYGAEVLERLRWMADVLGPVLQQAVRGAAPVDITAIIAQMLQMGDEGHNRNRAGTLMFLRDVLPSLIAADAPSSDVASVAAFVGGNDHFFLNLDMPACKLATDAARDVPGATLVVAMARNGTDFGIQVSGTGDQWFTAPANTPQGLFLGSFGPDDANPDIGDSAITETGGIGGFAMAAAPAIVRFVGGDVAMALAATRSMYEITLAEHPAYQVPILEFRGSPVGIDVTSVVRTGILPQINTGMAGAVAGTGQVGAGLVNPPAECFSAALEELARRVP